MKTGFHIVRDFLAASPEVDAPVVHRVPADRPARFVRVDYASAAYPTPATIETDLIVQIYGDPRLAWNLVPLLGDGLERLEDVFAVDDFHGPYRFDDPNGVERWQITFRLTHSSLDVF